jgi:deoxyribose-phosphate aldolase
MRGIMALVKIDELTAEQVASITDHTFLKQEDAFTKDPRGAVVARTAALDDFLNGAVSLKPYAVCVRHYDTITADEFLIKYGQIQIASVVAFPNPMKYVYDDGSPDESVFSEIKMADIGSADEIDFVMPTSNHWIKQKEIQNYVHTVNRFVQEYEMKSKLILEVSELTPEQIKWASVMAEEEGIDFVKTSTGYSKSGATVEALQIMRDNFTGGVKISGGVTSENYKDLLRAASGRVDGMIELDPSFVRIGASSLLPALYAGKKPEGGY